MGAQRLMIESKQRDKPIAMASLNDFKYDHADEINPRVAVEDPTVSLYCLDHAQRRAIFVQTAPGVDLSQAPFSTRRNTRQPST